jgi:hypothetical protein
MIVAAAMQGRLPAPRGGRDPARLRKPAALRGSVRHRQGARRRSPRGRACSGPAATPCWWTSAARSAASASARAGQAWRIGVEVPDPDSAGVVQSGGAPGGRRARDLGRLSQLHRARWAAGTRTPSTRAPAIPVDPRARVGDRAAPLRHVGRRLRDPAQRARPRGGHGVRHRRHGWRRCSWCGRQPASRIVILRLRGLPGRVSLSGSDRSQT